MINMNNSNDTVLKQRIDAIFLKYDTNRSGTLSLQELHVFLNDLLKSTGNNRHVTKQEAANVMKAIDINGDGRINKYQLFRCFKYLTKPHCKNKKPTTGGMPTGAIGGVPMMGGYGPHKGAYYPMGGYMPTVGVVSPVLPVGGIGMMGGYVPMMGITMPLTTMGYGSTGEYVIEMNDMAFYDW